MIEFFLSKIVMFSVGFVLIVVACSAFVQFDEDFFGQATSTKAQKLADALFQLDSSPLSSKCRFDWKELGLPSDSEVEIANGSVWIRWPDGIAVAECPRNLIMTGDRIALHEGDVLFVESRLMDGQRFLLLHSAKVDTISPSASKNLLLSSSVL